MCFRLTIRDLLWLTLVVALAVGWWVDRVAMLRQHIEALTKAKVHALEEWREISASPAPWPEKADRQSDAEETFLRYERQLEKAQRTLESLRE